MPQCTLGLPMSYWQIMHQKCSVHVMLAVPQYVQLCCEML